MGRKKQMNTGNIEIGTSISINNATMLHEKLLAAYKESEKLMIDLNGVTDCDMQARKFPLLIHLMRLMMP